MITSGSRWGTALVILFLLPFCAIGIFTGTMAAGKIAEGDWKEGAFLAIFALAFGGAGFGMLVALLFGSRKVRRQEELKAMNPSAPWRWREDWAEGRVKSGSKPKLAGAWIFAFFWNIISLPLAFLLPSEVIDKGNYAALIGLLFPLIGLGILVYAVHASLEWQRYRETIFQMSSVPGVIGGTLGGSLLLNTELNPADGFGVTLSCVRRVTTGSGKSRSTSDITLWQEERKPVGPIPRGDAPGCSVPVRFRVPFECKATDATDPDDQIVWQLEARASVPGVDFHEVFDVPVFTTEQSSPEATEQRIRSEDRSHEEAGVQPSPDSGIDIRISALGGTEYVFAKARNPGAAASLAVFFLIWTAITVVLVLVGAPVIFPLVFGAFDLLFVVILGRLLLAETHVVVESGSVAVRTFVLGLMWGKKARCDDITSVNLKIGSQTNRTSYYDLVLRQRSGRELDVWAMIRDKRQAEWLVDDLWRAIRKWQGSIPNP
jgi:hypothetical protein